MKQRAPRRVDIYLSCAREDTGLRQELEEHLALLVRKGLIRLRSSQSVPAGKARSDALLEMLSDARLILLLVSSSFMKTDECMTLEVPRALKCRRDNDTVVIPVILRSCLWRQTAFGELQPLPEGERTIDQLPNRDEAWTSIAKIVHEFAENAQSASETMAAITPGDQGMNPFEYGCPVAPERFFGRHSQISDIRGRIGAVSAQSVSVVGFQRSGKSSLLSYITTRIHEFCPPEQKPLVVCLDLQAKQYHTPEGLLEGLRRGIESKTGVSPWKSELNRDGFAVDDGLAGLCGQGIRLLVLLDEFERIGARLDRFQDWGEDFRAKASAGFFSLVIGTKRPLVEVYTRCGLTSPFGNIFSTTILGALLPGEWRAMVRERFASSGVIVGDADLELIDELSGGLPFYVQIAAALLWRHRNHSRTIEEFNLQFCEHFPELWRSLTPEEQGALRAASGVAVGDRPQQAIVELLTRHDLLRRDGRVFSSSFAGFVSSQR